LPYTEEYLTNKTNFNDCMSLKFNFRNVTYSLTIFPSEWKRVSCVSATLKWPDKIASSFHVGKVTFTGERDLIVSSWNTIVMSLVVGKVLSVCENYTTLQKDDDSYGKSISVWCETILFMSKSADWSDTTSTFQLKDEIKVFFLIYAIYLLA